MADEHDGSAPPVHGPYDAERPPPLVFHQWAQLSAELARRQTDERQEILERRGVDGALYDACNAFWLEALTGQIAAGNMRLAELYAEACVREMSARRQARDEPAARGGVVLADEDLDGTGLLVALPDQTALPFKPPAATRSERRAADANLTPESRRPDLRGETQIVEGIALDADALPFRSPDEEDDA